MRVMAEDTFSVNAKWMRDVREEYLSGADRKIEDLDRAIAGLEMNPTSRNHERRLRHLLHNLIGSGGSYGFPAVSDTARGMSECLRQRRDDSLPLDPKILKDLRDHLDRLRRIFGSARP